MKKILILTLILSLFLFEGCSLIGYGVGSGINKEDLHSIKEIESTDIIETAEQPAEIKIRKNVSFKAKKNPYIVVSFHDQQIEGLLMGIEADSVLLKNKQSSFASQIQRISVNEIHHIRVIRKTSEYFLNGLLIGSAIGVIVGIATGDDTVHFSSTTTRKISAEVTAVFWGMALGLLGGFLGASKGDGSERVLKYDLSEQDYFQKIQVIRKLSGYKS